MSNCKLCEKREVCDYAKKNIKDCGAYREKHEVCKTCKHFVKGGLDGKTYVCEHPNIEQDDYFNYAFLMVEENDFCSSYEARKKAGEDDGEYQG